MMKKLLLFTVCLTATFITKAQTTYTYDFGTSTGTMTAGSTPGNTTIPAPLANGGIARTKLSANTPAGTLEIINSNFTSPSGSALKMSFPGGTSGQKFSIFSWTDNTVNSFAKFTIKFEVPTVSSAFNFAIGNETASPGTGTVAGANNVTVNSALNLRWALTSSALTLQILSGTNTATNVFATGNPTFAFGTEYQVAVYSNNNSSSAISTVINSVLDTIKASSYHIYINGSKLLYATKNYDFPKHNISNDLVIEGLAFFSVGNTAGTGNGVANVDNLQYGNYTPTLVTLPVSLTSFTAKPLSNYVQLNWTTASESNNSHFYIEKSTDGVIFNKIITKTGAGNSSQVLNYTATDNNPSNGTSYYRLVQYDFDGKQTIYDPTVVKFGLANDANTLTIYTNSNSNELNFRINTQTDITGNFEIYNTNGQKVVTKKMNLNSGLNKLSVDTNLPSGTYIATFKSDGIILKQKFVR